MLVDMNNKTIQYEQVRAFHLDCELKPEGSPLEPLFLGRGQRQ